MVFRPGTASGETMTRKVLRKPLGATKRTSPWARSESTTGQGVEKELVDGLSQKIALRALQQLLRGGVDQGDVSIEPGGDQSAADGLNDVFVQRLQVLQRAAGVLQLDVHLAKLGRQQSGQVGDRQVAEQVDEDDGLQRSHAGVGGGIGRDDFEVGQLQDGAVKDEGQRRAQVRPGPRQQNAGHDDDQRDRGS